MNGVTLVRRIKARPSIVFDALTTADGIAAWWGPDDVPVVRVEVDPRVGGAYRVRFRTLDGREHEAYGTFLELAAPRRVVMTWRYALGGEPVEHRPNVAHRDRSRAVRRRHRPHVHPRGSRERGLGDEATRRAGLAPWTSWFDNMEHVGIAADLEKES